MDELEQKQTFLRSNILEKGYDAEEFMNFLQTKKGELGLDLNNWNIDELNIAVDEFIKSLQNPQEANKEEEIQKNNEEVIDNNINNNNQENMEQIKNNNEREELIECQLVNADESPLPKDTDIKLSFPQKTEGGLFSKSYVTYLMNTTPLDSKIRKRYSDFEWLRHILSSIYVNCVIPPLCKKNFTGRFSELLIAKRTRSIEKFMKGILIHPLMRHDEIFYNFISTENEAEFEKKKKMYNKINPPSSLISVKSLTGEINVNVNNEKEAYLQNIKKYLDINISTLQKITKGYKSLMIQMDQISDKMKEISQYWKEIYNANLNYNENPNTVESYNILSKIMQDWSETNKHQKILMNEGIREYFRYIKNEFVSMKELAQKVETNRIIYSKAFDKLRALKENTFKQDMSTWGMNSMDMENKSVLLNNKELAFSKMLPKETKRVDGLKNNYGFYLNSIIKEFERIKDLNNGRHKLWIKNFIKDLIESFTDLQINLNDRCSIYDEITDEIAAQKGENNINKNQEENNNFVEQKNNNEQTA
jgi:hypothetical protein